MSDFWVEKFKTEAVPKIVQEFQPQQILLFGSRINGDATEESDLDVIIVAESFKFIPFVKRMALALKKADFEKHIDFICYSPEEFGLIQNSSEVIQDALKYGESVSIQ